MSLWHFKKKNSKEKASNNKTNANISPTLKSRRKGPADHWLKHGCSDSGAQHWPPTGTTRSSFSCTQARPLNPTNPGFRAVALGCGPGSWSLSIFPSEPNGSQGWKTAVMKGFSTPAPQPTTSAPTRELSKNRDSGASPWTCWTRSSEAGNLSVCALASPQGRLTLAVGNSFPEKVEGPCASHSETLNEGPLRTSHWDSCVEWPTAGAVVVIPETALLPLAWESRPVEET